MGHICLANLEDYKKAIRYYEDALELDPNDPTRFITLRAHIRYWTINKRHSPI